MQTISPIKMPLGHGLRPSKLTVHFLIISHCYQICLLAQIGLRFRHQCLRAHTMLHHAVMFGLFQVIPLKFFYYQTFFETWRNDHS